MCVRYYRACMWIIIICLSSIHQYVLLSKANRQYLLTYKVNRHCVWLCTFLFFFRSNTCLRIKIFWKVNIECRCASRSHHTNSFAHIIIKFKNKKVSLFLKNAALCSSLGGKYYKYIILLPIYIDSVMIWCSKSIEMMKDRSNRKSLRWL